VYIKVAVRNLRREKLYATLNIAGFALGIGACLILGLYVWDELTYDRHHVDHERISRVAQHVGAPSGNERIESSHAQTSSALGPMLVEDFPSVVEQYVRFSRAGGGGRTLLRSGDDAEYWSDTYLADDNVFDVFTHEIVYGDPRAALTEPATIAISRTVAERYFGAENPVGRTLVNAVGTPFTVTLVFEDLPLNSHLRYDALFAFKGIFAISDDINVRRQMLNGVNTYTYIVLRGDYDPSAWPALSLRFAERHMADKLALNVTWESWLQPLVDIHFELGLDLDRPTSNLLYLYAMAAVGISLLLITCINYVNLATARAAKRARIIGLRKILGADRRALMAQLLGESLLFALLATAIGVVAVQIVLSLPAVTALFGKPLELDLLGNPLLAAAIAAFGVLIGLVAGLYPAFFLSSFVPVAAFSTRYKTVGSLRLREVLVFVQFMISVGVIASTLVMTAQMRYVADQALGFDAENRIVVPLRGADLIERHELVATELLKHGGVLGVTTSETIMGRGIVRRTSNDVETERGATRRFLYEDVGQVGADFVSVMGLRVIEGRDFSGTSGSEAERPVIVNETFVREMGWDEPIGKQIGRPGGRLSGRVIGVVEDYHFQSLHERIAPFAIYRGDPDYGGANAPERAIAERLMVVNVAQEGLRETLQYIRKTVEAFAPNRPFELSFLDEELDRLYTSDERFMKMIGLFAGICIFVACLGLFGLSAFTTDQRTKEIGIRKVCGASVAEIIVLLSRRVVLLIAVAGTVACVAAWNVMAEWLSGFAYRADIHPGYFVLAVVATASAALATIALQCWRAARARPVDALRYE
jgi:putative ABC transport system permease protein